MKTSKILVVDDEPDVIYLTKMVLNGPEFEITSAHNGEECFKIIESGERPDLILLDIMMPCISGYDVCKKLKGSKKTKNLKISFYSALPEEEIRKKMEEAGADFYLEKSFEIDALKSKVKEMLAQ
ncbi:MAG TPA: response regulator [bacterium]|nr:response regulator [bacterium]